MRTISFGLSLALIFIIPWENDITVGGLGSLARAVGILATLFWIATVFVRGRMRLPTPFHIAVCLFALWVTASLLWTQHPSATFDRAETYIQLFVLTLLLWDLCTTTKELQMVLQAYVLGGCVASVYTLFNYFAGVGYRGGTRFAVSGQNPNNMGVMLALGIPMAWYLATTIDWKRGTALLRAINYAYIPGALMAILLTASRTSLIATIPGFIYILMSFTRLRLFTRIIVFVGLAYALFAMQPLIPETSIERLSETGSSISSGDLTGRVDIWDEGVEFFLESPVIGIGAGTFREWSSHHQPAHNVFLSILAETGIVGMLLFLMVLLLVVWQMPRYKSWWERGLWLILLVVWSAGAIALNWEYRKVTWLILCLVVCSANVIEPEPEEEARAPSALLPPPNIYAQPSESVR